MRDSDTCEGRKGDVGGGGRRVNCGISGTAAGLSALLRLWTSGVRPACDGPSARALRTTDKHISPLPSVLSNLASVRHVLQHCPLAPMTPPHHASPPAHLTAAGHASPGPQPKAAGALHRARALLLRLARALPADPPCWGGGATTAPPRPGVHRGPPRSPTSKLAQTRDLPEETPFLHLPLLTFCHTLSFL